MNRLTGHARTLVQRRRKHSERGAQSRRRRKVAIYNALEPYCLLAQVVVVKSRLSFFVALGHKDVSRIHPLAILLLETPDLSGFPAVVYARHVGLDGVAILGFGQPVTFQVGIIDLAHLDKARFAPDFAEDVVVMLAFFIVEVAQFCRAFDSTCCRLLDVDVDYTVVVLILLDM